MGDKGDLLALRLTCRGLVDFCRSLVFKHVSRFHSEGGVGRLVEMATSTSICESVQRITYDTEDLGIHYSDYDYAEVLGIPETALTLGEIDWYNKNQSDLPDVRFETPWKRIV